MGWAASGWEDCSGKADGLGCYGHSAMLASYPTMRHQVFLPKQQAQKRFERGRGVQAEEAVTFKYTTACVIDDS